MALTTIPRLLDTLRALQLLTVPQCDELARQRGFATSQDLGRELIRRGWLSPYQVNHLLQGRGQELVLGSYILVERLGEGGMGEVFKARHVKLGQAVALKVIRKDRLQDSQVIHRFHREIRAVATLNHPNIVRALDADVVGQTHFYAMEYVQGVDLARLVKQAGPLSVPQACAYVRQAALALQHVFEHGLIHRDIKPSNLLANQAAGASGDEALKLLDLGLARMLIPDNAETNNWNTLTQEGSVLGSVDFLAPEQAMNARQVDIRADLYSLGCTFYFLLTGRTPFTGGTATEKLVKHRLDEPPALEQLRPDVPYAVRVIVRKLMAKKPEHRYQTPAEVVAAFDNLGRPVTQRFPVVQLGRTTGHGLTALARQAWRHPLWLAALVVVLLTTLAALALYRSATGPRFHPRLGYELTRHPVEAVEFNGHWYRFFPEKVTSWQEARTRCQRSGGYLVCIESADEERFVVGLARGANCWLGGYNDEQRNWFWITGQPISLTFWTPGQPNNGGNVYLQLIGPAWHDIGKAEQPQYAAGYTCEWDF